MQVGGVRRIDADFQRLQPVAVDQALEGEGMRAGGEEAVEVGEGGGVAFTQIGEDDAVLHHDGVGALAHPLAEHAAFGLGGRLQALAVDVEQPAMEQAAQAAVFQTAIGEIGAAMRAVAVQQAVAAALVAEQHEVLAEHAHRLGGPLLRQLVGERHRMPIVPHQRAAFGARPDAGDQLVLLGTHHGTRVTQSPARRKALRRHARRLRRTSSRRGSSLQAAQPGRDVSMGVQYAPDIDVIVLLDVEDEIRVALQHPATQPRKRKLMSRSRRSGGGMIRDHAVRGAQRFHEGQGDFGAGFPNVVVNGRFGVPTCQFTRSERLFAHLPFA